MIDWSDRVTAHCMRRLVGVNGRPPREGRTRIIWVCGVYYKTWLCLSIRVPCSPNLHSAVIDIFQKSQSELKNPTLAVRAI